MTQPSPVAVNGSFVPGIAGSIPAEVIDVRPLSLLCRKRPLRRADRSSKGVLPSVVSVWYRNPNAAARAPVGLYRRDGIRTEGVSKYSSLSIPQC